MSVHWLLVSVEGGGEERGGGEGWVRGGVGEGRGGKGSIKRKIKGR